jgi:hypothetical protein
MSACIIDKYSDSTFSLMRTVGPTKMIFLSSKKLGKEYENDIFVSDIKKWKDLSIQVGREKR